MKFQALLFIAALGAVSIFSSCGSDSGTAQDATSETAVTQPDAAAPALNLDPTAAPATAATPEPAQNAAGVWHYTCSKGCAGGGAAAGPCAKCGTTLVHNQAYHGTASATGAANPTGAPDKATITMPNAQKPEPPQNAAGVWHYTCADGCAGGAGGASPCAKCGKTLVHNTAYHK
jgi:hypothetical protein